MEIVSGARAVGDTGTVFYLVRKVAAVTGRICANAKPTIDENNRPAVSFSLTNEGSRKFGKVTGENIGRYLAIVLDNRVDVGAAHRRQDHDDGRISGELHDAGSQRPRR